MLDRWPWLENKAEILSGEASMLANPGGTFMYAVWNQWQEEITTTVDEYGIVHTEEEVFDSDILFRRLMYLPDDSRICSNDPTCHLLYVSSTMASWETDTLTLAATARDLDKLGDVEIVEYLWTYTSADGVYVDEPVGTEKVLQIELPGWAKTPGQPGWANF